ncbi:MAG: phosphotransferase [Candidatus Hodarchaeota archaeon]
MSRDLNKLNSNSKLLNDIPKTLLPNKIISTRVIKGGLNNRNILLNENWLVKQYLHRDEENDPVYLRFLRERETLLLLKDNPHVPKLLKYHEDPPNLYLVREWVRGRPITVNQIQKNPTMLIEVLISIHKGVKSTGGDFQYLDVIKRYLREYNRAETSITNDPGQFTDFSDLPPYHQIEQFYTDCLFQIQDFNSSKDSVRIHGDLVFSNIILTEEQRNLVFIDWEYSTLGNPLIDLAYLFSQNQVPLELQWILINEYESQLKVTVNPDELKGYYNLMSLMSALWYAIQAFRLKSSSLPVAKQEISLPEFIKLALETFSSLNLYDNLSK